MVKFVNLGLRRKLQLAFGLVSLLTVGVLTTQTVIQSQRDAYKNIDTQLTAAAQSFEFVLGPDYINNLPPRDKVDLAQKRAEGERVTHLAEALKVVFVYGFIEREGKWFYVQSGLTPEQMKDGKTDYYLLPNDLPDVEPKMREAVKTGKPTIHEGTSQYGTLRTLLIPKKTKQGDNYVLAADQDLASVKSIVQESTIKAASTGLVLLVVSILVAMWLGNLIAAPLQRLSNLMKDLTTGSGDLTLQLPVNSQDEIGQIASYFNVFMSQLRDMFLAVQNDTVKLTQGVLQINEMTNRLSDDAHQQSDMAASTAATIEEITVSINQIADNTREADTAVQRTGQLSESSAISVQSVAQEVSRAAKSMDELSGVMDQLDGRTQQISTIVNVIKEIADQTNLLALNAAIEAARAGEQGRGFAVVADEVRKLAERTARATVEITEMINSMRSDSGQAMTRMKETLGVVESGVDMAESSAQQIRSIQNDMRGVVDRIRDITNSANEQSIATVEMAKSAERISVMAQDGDAAIQTAKEVVDSLSDLAAELSRMVSRFKL